MTAHIITNAGPHHPQGPPHHVELFKRSPVGFLLKSTGNPSRSVVQEQLEAQIHSRLVLTCLALTIQSFQSSLEPINNSLLLGACS